VLPLEAVPLEVQCQPVSSGGNRREKSYWPILKQQDNMLNHACEIDLKIFPFE
jgi:hypothetical protein